LFPEVRLHHFSSTNHTEDIAVMAQGMVMHTTLKENIKETSENLHGSSSTVSDLLMTTFLVMPATKRKGTLATA